MWLIFVVIAVVSLVALGVIVGNAPEVTNDIKE